MSALHATVLSGRLVLDEPIELPEGSKVRLVLIDIETEDDSGALDRAALDAAIDEAAASVARGEAINADEVLRRIDADDEP